jgi:hypothetical protein
MTHLQLPSLEFLARINARMIVFSVMMLLAGFLVGVVLNLANHRRGAHELPWQDPVVWTSSILVAWMVAAALFNALYPPARLGRKVAYLTVATFAFLVIVLALRLSLPSEHGGTQGPGAEVGSQKSEVRGQRSEVRSWGIGYRESGIGKDLESRTVNRYPIADTRCPLYQSAIRNPQSAIIAHLPWPLAPGPWPLPGGPT